MSSKPEIYRLKPVTCRPAQEHSRHEPLTNCRQEPTCVVTDIPILARPDDTSSRSLAFRPLHHG